jgi:hypothetical protein
VADDHFEIGVAHLMRHVLRTFSARKLKRRERVAALVAALVDDAVAQT